ncbi:MAG: polysaccharide deacetylase family protein [Alphaproteobacteria bacterium]|nr:polysaccharide deacetylase family protein [Alphaproteobacteria bacterium]
MRIGLIASLFGLALWATPLAAAPTCANPGSAIGVERVVEVDAKSGPLFGVLTKQQREPTFLRDKEVVLTFDDGPSPWVTTSILDTLERHCTKATFFAVGKMAVSYPDVARDIIARGHTLGGHTWSHPRQLPKMKPAKAHDQIERGFAALEAATAGGIAPFFRFTGLNDSAPLLDYLQKRGIATFTVDVVSDDSFIASPDELTRLTLQRVRQRSGGIMLFHDIKPATAKALPAILKGLKAEGFKVVHMRATKPVQADAEMTARYLEIVQKKLAKSHKVPRLMPFYGAISELRETEAAALAGENGLTVSRIAPAPRDRGAKRSVTVRSVKPNRVTQPPAKANRPAKSSSKPKSRKSGGDEPLPWKIDPGRNKPAAARRANDTNNGGQSSSWQYHGPRAGRTNSPLVR